MPQANTDTTERALLDDLRRLGDRFRDEEFATELYRALANNRWSKDGHPIALSWSRAEELVNRLREERGEPPLTLAQTGGEGEVSRRIATEVGAMGWSRRPLDTSEHQDDHAGRPASPPPPDAGERRAPVSDSHEWERQAHAEAEATRRGDDDAPPAAGPGGGAGGGAAPRVGGS